MAYRGRRLVAGVTVFGLLAGFAVAAGWPAGAEASAGRTERVSVRADGSPVPCDDCAVGGSAISATGRYVAFATSAELDPVAAGETDVYVRDRQAPERTVLISRGNAVAANGPSLDPAISADGRYVAFDTDASDIATANFPSGDATNGEDTADVVLCDRDPEGDGTFDKLLPSGGLDQRCLIVGDVATNITGYRLYSNYHPSISADGTTLAYQQYSTAVGGGGVADVVVGLTKSADGDLQAPSASAYTDISPALNDSTVSVGLPRLSGDGRHVVFVAGYQPAITAAEVFPAPGTITARLTAADSAPPACGDAVEVADAPLADPVASVIGVAGTVEADAPPAISSDGSVLAFGLLSGSVCDPGESGGPEQVHVVDRDHGTPTTEFVASTDTSGAPGQSDSGQPALSADGRYLTFQTTAPNLDNGPLPDGAEQVVERDLVLDRQRAQAGASELPAELASTCGQAAASCDSDVDSSAPVLDADGGVVAFLSAATDLVPDGAPGDGLNFFARQYLPTVTAAPLAFGTIARGTSAQATITVSQSGFGPVPIGGLSITGPNSGDFTVFPAQSCADTTLYETGQCLVSIRYTPLGLGQRTATLVLDTSTPVAAALTGGAGPPINGFTATPNPVVFPGQRLALAASAPQTVTVTDTSAAPFTITGVALPAGPGLYPRDYLLTADSCSGITLAPGATCQMVVVDRPQGAGSRPAALAFTDTTGGSPQLVGLSSVATTPTVRLSPAVSPGGRVITVRGQGFPADHPVTVRIPGEPAAPELTAATDDAGSFSIGLPIFTGADVGSWPVLATASGLDLSAAARVLIVLGTYQPPDFTTRG